MLSLLLTTLTLWQCDRTGKSVKENKATQNKTVMQSESKEDNTKGTELEKVVKTDAEWKAQLTDMEYRVAREDGTERAFSGRYWNLKDDGVYHCVCCDLPLFDSETKYASGSGWPAFYAPVKKEYVDEKLDKSLGMTRAEIECKRCGCHLGHVFDDGPEPTGLRYCVNSVSLKFKEREEEK